jgi:hypothetical protein
MKCILAVDSVLFECYLEANVIGAMLLTVFNITIRFFFHYSLFETLLRPSLGILSELVGIDLCHVVMSFSVFFKKTTIARGSEHQAARRKKNLFWRLAADAFLLNKK